MTSSQDSGTSQKASIRVVSAGSSLLSPTESAVSDAATSLFKSSVTANRDYAKFMVPICSGEVPTYLALLKYVGYPASLVSPLSLVYVLTAIPAILFVLASVVFVLGVMPERYSKATLDKAEDAEGLYERAVNGGRMAAIIGTTVFLSANVAAILIVSYALTY